MLKVYNFLVMTVWAAFLICIGCTGWLEIYGYENNFNIILLDIGVGIYALFMGIAAISLEIDLISKG